MTEPFRKEAFGQDVSYVIVNSPMLTDHVQRRLASIYNISATDDGNPKSSKRDNSRQPKQATHVKMFPGAIVCSLLRCNLRELADSRNNYVALEKTDGVRYLLLLTTLQNIPYAILIDRKMEMRIVNLDMPFSIYEKETLFDGELAQNIENGLYTFLIFDMIHTGVPNEKGEYVKRDTPYTYRMKRANELVCSQWKKHLTTDAEYDAYNAAASRINPSTPKNTFALKVKRYVPFVDFENTFVDVHQRDNWIYHGFKIDGFIFVRSRQLVEPFRNAHQYKFKPTEQHTIDVQLLQISADSFELFAKNARNAPDRLSLVNMCSQNQQFITKYNHEIQECQRKKSNFIVECSWSASEKSWILKQPRFDKQTPNAVHTIEQTKRNIDEDIKLSELVALCPKTTPIERPLPPVATEPTIPVAPKGPFVHPSRLRNFNPIAAAEHNLSATYSAETCDNDCACNFCAEQHYDPQENWKLEDEPDAKRACIESDEKSKSNEKTASEKAKIFLSSLDLDSLLQTVTDPTKVETVKKIVNDEC